MLVIVLDKAIMCAFMKHFHLLNTWDFLDKLFIIFKIEVKLEALL